MNLVVVMTHIFFLQSYVFNFIFEKNNCILNNNLNIFKEIGIKLSTLAKKELDLGFWYLIDYFNLDKLDIYAPYNGFKQEFPVSNIFN